MTPKYCALCPIASPDVWLPATKMISAAPFESSGVSATIGQLITWMCLSYGAGGSCCIGIDGMPLTTLITLSGHSHCTAGEKTPILTAPLHCVLPGGTKPGMQTPSGAPSLRQGGPASVAPEQQYESPMQSVLVVQGPRILPHLFDDVQMKPTPPSPQSEFCMHGS